MIASSPLKTNNILMKNRFLGFLIMIILCTSCAKNDYLPDVPVNFSSPLTDPRISSLSAPLGVVSLTGYGIAGIIIYRRADNSYVAFDRCSTVNPEQKNAVVVQDSFTATDLKSGAKFNLNDGGAAKAPAKNPLKQYSVVVTTTTLQVTN